MVMRAYYLWRRHLIFILMEPHTKHRLNGYNCANSASNPHGRVDKNRYKLLCN